MPAGLASITDTLSRAAVASVADADLLARFVAARDEFAFAELVRRHGPLVYRESLRTAGPDAADDVFQATFLILARRADRLEQPDRLAGWLFGVAGRVARRARSQSARRRRVERPVAQLPDAAAPSAEPADWRAVIHEELARLPTEYRAAVVLCDLEGHTRRDAAQMLGVPDGTLSNRLTRARAMLGRRLVRRGVALVGIAGLMGGGSVPSTLAAATVPTAISGAAPTRVLILAAERSIRMTLIRVGVLTVAGLAAALTLTPAAGPVQPPAAAAVPAPPTPPPDPTPVDGMYVRGLTLTPNRKLIAVSEWQAYAGGPEKQPTITFFDAATFKPVRKLSGPGEVCGKLQFAPDGKTAYVADPDWVSLHRVEVASWKVLGTLNPDSGHLIGFTLSPDGKTLATYHLEVRVGKPRQRESRVALWDASTLAHFRDLQADAPLSGPLAFSPDGAVLAVACGGAKDKPRTVRVMEIDPATGKEVRRCVIEPGGESKAVVCDLAYSPDGKQVVIAGGEAIPYGKGSSMLYGHAYHWNRESGKLLRSGAANPNDYFRQVVFAADGRRVYLGSTGQTQRTGKRDGVHHGLWNTSKVQCWDTSNLDWPMFTIHWSADGEFASIDALLPDPTGTRLLAADSGGLWVFDAATGQRRGGLIKTRRD